ncbi:MAG: metallophosphoesterase [Bacilli bacterium]|nr:metallophosphoesterase [Bacilli bacterium]
MTTRTEKNKKIQDEIIREEATKKFKKISKIFFIIFGSIFLIIMYGMYIGAKVVIVKEERIYENIDINYNGIKIVHISDLLYNSLNKNDLEKIKNQINEINPDIILFTGNIKKDNELNKEDLEILKNFFGSLNAKINKYAVLGNYDDDSFNTVIEQDFKILNNNNDLLYYKTSSPLEFIGFNTNDLKYDDIKESNNEKICLMSNPDKIDDILEHVNCNIIFAGETLGGEVKLFGIPIFDNHKYNKDYYQINNTKLYISNGLGNTINVRYFNHPTINLYRLTKIK